MSLSPTVKIRVTGARGPRGPASGPLTAGSVGADEISNSPTEQQDIRDKLGLSGPESLNLFGFSHDETYAAGTEGRHVTRLISAADEPWAATGTGTETTAITDMLNYAAGDPVDLPLQYKVAASLENKLGSRFMGKGQLLASASPGGFYLQEQQTDAHVYPTDFNQIMLYRLLLRLKLSSMAIASGSAAQDLTWIHFGNSISATGSAPITGSISGSTLTVTVGPDPNATGVLISKGSLIQGAAPNTRVTGYGTGLGGTGTYTVSVPQTLASTSLVANNGGSYAGTAAEPQALIRSILSENGVLNIVNLNFRNRAIGGTNPSDVAWIQDLDQIGGTTDVMSFGPFGTNIVRDEDDPAALALALLDYYTQLDTLFTAIRANSFGQRHNLCLMLVGNTNTYDPLNNRTSIFYERARAIEVAIALKHGLFYYNPLAMMPGNVGWLAGRTYGMDNPFSNGSSVHTLEIPQVQWVEGWMNAVFKPHLLALWDKRGPQSLSANLDAGWTNYSGFIGLEFQREASGQVTIEGMIAPGILTATTRPFFLPAKARPRANIVRNGYTDAGVAVPLRFESSGNVILIGNCPSTAYLNVGGITFQTR